jgi:hypothetical protein
MATKDKGKKRMQIILFDLQFDFCAATGKVMISNVRFPVRHLGRTTQRSPMGDLTVNDGGRAPAIFLPCKPAEVITRQDALAHIHWAIKHLVNWNEGREAARSEYDYYSAWGGLKSSRQTPGTLALLASKLLASKGPVSFPVEE